MPSAIPAGMSLPQDSSARMTSSATLKLAYTVPEAARALGVSRATLYSLNKTKRIIFSKVGRRTVIRADHLAEFAANLPTV